MIQPIKTKPTDDGGSAFPHGEIIAEQHDSAGNFSGNIVHHESAGMSLRDWFAGMALQGMFGNQSIIDSFSHHKLMAEESFNVADEMLAARKAKP
jgi:hypothetical protein